ncbi:hypothetical protein ASG38_14430 [Flavobacterium sp. Leaf359]|uniref:T9SS type A sorting domain-containing protein n=1 Tax=Flavobacterium sp. Leaf359 TaxID=1736351 RepID=UPI0006FDEB85|nr:T9SS type A sorting domain-containing protein [Flavobacterium sp. Leaf359]KQS45810.1 hypothetical protein ASG38_14430 [Flavobacterium sp. Leaf359]
MKKQLLLAGLLLGSVFTINAQTTISFEASEGYTLGNIHNKNGWVVTGDPDGNYIENQVVTNALASNGTQSLKIDEDELYGPQQNTIMGAFYAFTPLASSHYSISADYYISALDASNFGMQLIGATSYISRFEFNYEGDAATVETVGTGLAWSPIAGFSWVANRWYNLKIEVNGTEVKYYVDNVLIRTGATTITEQVQQLRFVHDNYGGFAYVDNIVMTDLALGVGEQVASNFSVYPNPSNGLVNISNDLNSVLTSVSLTDLNGRTVKTAKLNGDSSAQINIADLAAGVYMMTINSDQGSVTKKIIKN